MSTYDLDEMVKRWGQDRLTADQAIGQILQHLQGVAQRLGDLERVMEEQRTAVSAKSDKEKTKPKKARGKKKQ